MAVSLKEDLIAAPVLEEQSHACEMAEFPLDSSLADSRHANDLPDIESFLVPAKKTGQDRPAGFAE